MSIHLFNRKAKPARKPVVAIDGTAASGKGTLAKALAEKLGYAYLDTGALYRTVALAVLKSGGDPSKLEDVKPVLGVINADLKPEALKDPALREPAVAEAVPKVAAMEEVRAVVRAYQESFMRNPPGNAPGSVLDGRDIGTGVCPDAEVKFYVTASVEERARRRYAEMKAEHPELTQAIVQRDLEERDRQDSTRHNSPLRAAADAVVIDTTSLTPPEGLEKALAVVAAKMPKAAAPKAPKRKLG